LMFLRCSLAADFIFGINFVFRMSYIVFRISRQNYINIILINLKF
jgi:hypothetical protein